ncbi:MAG: hypothetical protein F4Y04_06660 [Chloroflexi bacterium]|nr:hypothetical protein [Chloroflexota bacterium]
MTPGPVRDSYPGPDPDPPVPPIADAEAFAEEYGLDQVVVIGRKHGEDGFECVTTWGRSDDDARVCDLIANRFKAFVMQWAEDNPDEISERVRLGRAASDMRKVLGSIAMELEESPDKYPDWMHTEVAAVLVTADLGR